MKVVDASALAAIVFGESRAEEVARRLEDEELMAPTLLGYELANVAVTKLRREPERRQELFAALDLLLRLEIEEVQVPAEEAARLADQTGLSAYDASYLWLAGMLRTELVTLDEKLRKVAET